MVRQAGLPAELASDGSPKLPAMAHQHPVPEGCIPAARPLSDSHPEGELSASSSVFADTIAALQLNCRRHDTARAGRRLSDAVVRGAVTGVALRGGLHLVSYIAGLLAPKRRRAGGSTASRSAPSARELVLDTARYGAFLGCFSGVFVAADEAIACFLGARRTSAWRALAAGALAGPTLLLTGRHTSHTSLALYVLLRGITLLVRCGNLPSAALWKRRLLAPTRWRHGDVFLMCLSTCQFGYSWILMPSTLPPSYVRFLNKHGGKELYVLDAVREMCTRQAAGNGTAGKLAALQGTPHEHFSGSIPCEFLHPGLSCSVHTALFIPEGLLRALRVYLPVYVIPAALVHRKRLLAPGSARAVLWRKMAMGVLRSSAFLTLYCALAWRGACFGFNTRGATAASIVATCWIAGLATLVEKKSRRMELALYCLSRSVEAFALTLATWGWVSKRWMPRRLDMVLFSAATAAICHCYSDHFGARRDVFRSKYLAVFDFILGNTGFEASGISHAPSNVELLTMAGQRLARSVRSMSNLVAANSDAVDRKRGAGDGSSCRSEEENGSTPSSPESSSKGTAEK